MAINLRYRYLCGGTLIVGLACWYFAILCLLGISSCNTPTAMQPTIPNNKPVERICLAYDILSRIDERHRRTPPELFHLLDLPADLASTPSDSPGETRLRHKVMQATYQRTAPHHERLRRAGRNTAEYNHSRLVVYSWNVVADVVATAGYRKVYYEHFYSGFAWKLGQNVKGFCGGYLAGDNDEGHV